ncbi:4850_t:CDS:2, partial [Acaulospora colombiana]
MSIRGDEGFPNSTLKEFIENHLQNYDLRYHDCSIFSEMAYIGEGGFAKVFKAKCDSPDLGSTVALKIIKRVREVTDQDCKNLLNELKIYKRLNFHENVLKFHGYSCHEEQFVIILEYADGGTLQRYLEENFSKMNWNGKIAIAMQISLGIEYLHAQNVIHRDLV